jgi:hypothetical protein
MTPIASATIVATAVIRRMRVSTRHKLAQPRKLKLTLPPAAPSIFTIGVGS